MKVILLEDVKKVGRKFDIVDVSSGYARNSLIPQKKAVAATPAEEARIKTMRAEQGAAAENNRANLEKSISAIDGKVVTIKAEASESGSLYQKVTAEMIAAAINNEFKTQFEVGHINLKQPLKQAESTDVIVSLDKDTSATITVSFI